MAKNQSKTSKEDNKEVKTSATKPKLPTKEYTLINGVSISGIWRNKGEKVSLTKKGYEYFKSIKKVK